MMKKILLTILIFITSLTLVGCFLIDETTFEPYESTSVYEQQIIDSAEKLKYTTVTLKSNNEIGSAVIINKKGSIINQEYLAVTTSHFALNSTEFNVISPKSKKTSPISSRYYNEEYDLGLIVFSSSDILDVVNYRKSNNEIYPVTIGQSVLTSSTNSLLEDINSLKLGNVSETNISNNMFIHNASINVGEVGSGVYDMAGNLIGINTNIVKSNIEYSDENLFGLNYANTLNALVASIDSIDFNVQGNFNIDESKLSSITYSDSNLNELEEAALNVYNTNKDSVVSMDVDNEIYSGIIFKKENNNYYVLTKYSFDFTAKIYVNNNDKVYEAISIPNIISRVSSVFMFSSEDNLSVYNSQVINTNVGINNVSGQKAVTISATKEANNHHIDISTLSLPNYNDTGQFMIDGKLNNIDQGSPVFNLKGELIGINNGKEELVSTDIYGEGLNYVVNINTIAELMNNEKITDFNLYESIIKHEKDIINLYKNVKDVVVTVITNLGHGSGTIFKKEKTSNGYLYYVLTNHHVINDVSEAGIIHNSTKKSYMAIDYQSSMLHDVAILRFETSDELPLANSPILNELQKSEHQQGQIVIAVGTPEDPLKQNYITTGVLGVKSRAYNITHNLGLVTDVALNPGNSGGPLFNLKGEFIGINVSKITKLAQGQNYYLAERVSTSLNLNVILEVIKKFKSTSYDTYAERGAKLGISVAQVENLIMEDPSFIDKLPRTINGIAVIGVDQTRDSFGKIKVFDLIVGINGKKVRTTDDIESHLVDGTFGDIFFIELLRLDLQGNVTTLIVEVKLS